MKRGRSASAAGLLLGLALVSAGLPAAVTAQELPPPQAAYVEADPAAQRISPIDAEDTSARSALEASLRRDPRNPVLRLQMAQQLLDRGLRARVTRELDAAVRGAQSSETLLRTVHFNAGWMRFRLGEFGPAREHWLRAAELHGGRPDWLPVALALSLWSEGDRESALAYFSAAAEARPEQWGSADALEASAQAFAPNERFALQSMQQALADRAR